MGLKFNNKKKKDRFDDKDRKIRLNFDKIILKTFIGYLYIESKFISRANYINMKKLFDILDMEKYENDEEMYDYICFIKLMLEARLDQGISNKEILLTYCTKSTNTNFARFAKEVQAYSDIKESEIRYINKAVVDRLKYAYLVFYKDMIYEEFERIDTGEFDSFEEINASLKEIVTRMTSEMRRAETLVSLDTFSLADDVFDTVVVDIVKQLKDKSRRFKTGIRALNKLLSPGFISGRLYLWLGLTGKGEYDRTSYSHCRVCE